jgi:hypothetical protein
MRLVLTFFVAFIFNSSVLAHDHDHPELDQWYRSLRNSVGHYCCDGSDAFSVEDPDWEITTDPEFPYNVFLEGSYRKVPKDAVVKGPNKAGPAKVWPIYIDGAPAIRCFLPGAGA